MATSQSPGEISSQLRNSIMVFVAGFVATLCIPLAGFFVYILDLTEKDIKSTIKSDVEKIETLERKVTKLQNDLASFQSSFNVGQHRINVGQHRLNYKK